MPTPPPEPPSPLRGFRNGPALQREYPALASAFKQLAWIQDGIDATESSALNSLLAIGLERPSEAATLVFLDWVQDGIDGRESQSIELLRGLGESGLTLVVIALPWVWDGVDGDVEVNALSLLAQVAGSPSAPAFAILSLPWVRDGLAEREFAAIELLYGIGDLGAASSVVALGWVRDGIHSDVEMQAFQTISQMASREGGPGSAVVSLNWVSDGIDDEMEVDTIKQLSYLADEDSLLAESLISKWWMQDNLAPREAQAVNWIRATTGVDTASAIVSLGWVQDGIDSNAEVAAIQQLSYASNRNTQLATSAISLQWIQDGIDGEAEVDTIGQLSHIAEKDAELARLVVSFEWMQDSLDATEAEAVDGIRSITGVEAASAVVSLSWVGDGIDNDAEVDVIQQLSYASYRDTALAQYIASVPWLRDGLHNREAAAVKWLSRIAFLDPAVASSVLSLGWVQDGIGDALEVDALEELYEISYRKPDVASALLGMPFLETVEPPDVVALRTLRLMAASDSQQTFQRVMSSPAMREGITDDLAPVVATISAVAQSDVSLVEVLLTPSRVSVETRTIDLPRSGEVALAIIRTAPGDSRSMGLLEGAVRSIESMVAAPLPTNYVGLLFEDAVPEHSGAVNSGTHITMRPEYDAADGSYEADAAGHLIAHEVSHYYWTGNADWIDEGMAELFATLVEHDRTGLAVEYRNWPCPFVRTIAGLEALAPRQTDDAFPCNYSLGERFFIDLLRVHGREQFLLHSRDLYAKSQAGDGPALALNHIAQTFPSNNGATGTVVDRWYHGTAPYDLTHLGLDPSDPATPAINGRIDRAYLSGVDVVGWRHFTLEYSYDVSEARVEVPLDIVERYEDGFVVRSRTFDLIAESRLQGGIQRLYYGPPPGVEGWPAGRYTVHVYQGDQQIAQLEYQVED